jgi:hypothetical protein
MQFTWNCLRWWTCRIDVVLIMGHEPRTTPASFHYPQEQLDVKRIYNPANVALLVLGND